eukprot:SAG31_NODE_42746_length_270_cov_0.608187_1_plen_54_part_01
MQKQIDQLLLKLSFSRLLLYRWCHSMAMMMARLNSENVIELFVIGQSNGCSTLM